MLRRLVVDWTWPECVWSCPHYEKYVTKVSEGGPTFANTKAEIKRDKGKLDRVLGDLLGLRSALDARLREIEEQIGNRAYYDAMGFDTTGDYPEGNMLTRFLGHLVHRDVALRYFWGVFSKKCAINTWCEVTLAHTRAFLKWVTRHIVCQRGTPYALARISNHSPIRIPNYTTNPPPTIHIQRSRHTEMSGWYKARHYKRLVLTCCNTWGGDINMLQIGAGTLEYGLTPHTHTACRGLRHLGIHTSLQDYTDRYGGLNGVWVPKTVVTPDTATIVGEIHTLLSLPLPIRIILVAPSTWWDTAGIMGLHSAHMLPDGATYQVAGGNTNSHGHVRARVIQNLHAAHKWYVPHATVIARFGPAMGKWGLRGLYTPQQYPCLRALEPEADAISVEMGSEASSPPSSPTIAPSIAMPITRAFDEVRGPHAMVQVPITGNAPMVDSPLPPPPTLRNSLLTPPPMLAG